MAEAAYKRFEGLQAACRTEVSAADLSSPGVCRPHRSLNPKGRFRELIAGDAVPNFFERRHANTQSEG